MQPRRINFIVQGRNLETIVNFQQNSIKITVISLDNYSASQHIYTDTALPPPSGALSFKKIDEVYYFLAGMRSSPDKWTMLDANTLQVANSPAETLKIPLKPIADPLQASRVALMRASVSEGKQQDLSGIQQELVTLRSGYSSIGNKLKSIGELFEELRQYTDQNTKNIAENQQTIASYDSKIQECHSKIQENWQKAQESIENSKLSIDILSKTMHRNVQTLKQANEKIFEEIKKEICHIWADIEKYDFMKIKRENEQILGLFELEIKVKDHQFVPDQALLSLNRKLHWLNKRTLKNLEDVKDYNKAVAEHPLLPGISKLRILVHSIKNNGLLIGICSRKAKESLDSTAFNDQSMISFNSCGYVTNRGAMVMTNARVKQGDTIKMLVNLSQGVITWFCNDIGVAMADMGALNKEEVFAVIGLGYFGDEVQILQCEIAKKNMDLIHETSYAKQLQKMNEKFGYKRRQ